MAELEQASLKSEQLSDKSSSPALPDDLSLDEQSVYQMAVKEGKVSFLSEKLSFWMTHPPNYLSIYTLKYFFKGMHSSVFLLISVFIIGDCW